MKIDWSAYRITLLLYLGILLLPLSFYFSYSSFNEIKEDTKVLNSLTSNTTNILYFSKLSDIEEKKEIQKSIESSFKSLKPWMLQNSKAQFYVGASPLLKEFENLVVCWNLSKIEKEDKIIECYKRSKSLIFSLNNMLKLKQNRMYNIFYINLFVAMALLLSLVFFVRGYIYRKISNSALYDLETELYTKEYLITTLKSISARMLRNDEALFLVHMKIENLDESNSKEIFKRIGEVLLTSIRKSDLACRYGKKEFIIVLPDTSIENIVIITDRMKKTMHDIIYSIEIIEHYKGESYEEFIKKLH